MALLPHDRTEAQRKREHSDFSFLTLGSAWLPPVLAVAVCGLQMSFWENATNYTGEMFDLLLFAFVIWSLLEYRLDEREGRLYLAAFVYGAGMANNWAMVGFLPAFFVAVVWIRGLSFFNLLFLKRMFLCGLLGMTFYLLLPIAGRDLGQGPGDLLGGAEIQPGPPVPRGEIFLVLPAHPQFHLEFLALFAGLPAPVVRAGDSLGSVLRRSQPHRHGVDQSPVSSGVRRFFGLHHLDGL